MNEYDNENDELDDNSSGNSFRARSNTWPLNRPDFSAPSSNVCVDETLPEIELEEDDLFTTNENWSAGFVDHDIMSWDPILNAQNQQGINQPSVIHHQPQPQQVASSHSQTHQLAVTQSNQRQQPIHLQHPQQHPNHLQQHCSQHFQPHDQQQSPSSHHQAQQTHDLFLTGSGPSELMINAQSASQQQASPNANNQHEQRLHETLNNSRCLDNDDPNEYHIRQLHQLHLDSATDPQQEHYQTTNDTAAPTSQMSSMCLTSTSANPTAGEYISPTPHHQQSHLQPLTSARYNFDHHTQVPQPHLNQQQNHHQHHQHRQTNDYDIKLAQDDNLNNHHHLDHQQSLHHTTNHPQTRQHDQHLNSHSLHNEIHLHHHHQHHGHHQYHDLTSTSLENDNGGSHMLSSSIGTSGVGMSADLEDLDYKPTISPNFDETTLQQQQTIDQTRLLQQTELQSSSSENVKSESHPSSSAPNCNKQTTDSTCVTKSKLNAPRRNAWGNLSYADLISQAIESTSDKRLTLAQIYDWMVQHVPYFKDKGDSNSSAGWKNSVRHNLSLHSRFKRLQNEGTGKSSWWTINPEAHVGKCARRRAASMEASKYEKKRGRAKKKVEAIRQGLVSYPSLTNSSLNGSTSTLADQQSQAQSLSHFHAPAITSQSDTNQQQQQHLKTQDHNLQSLDQFTNQQQQSQQQQQAASVTQLQISTLESYNIDQPSQQQQQHLRQLQQADKQDQQQRRLQQHRHEYDDNVDIPHHGYVSCQQMNLQSVQQQDPQQVSVRQFEDNDGHGKLQQQQQTQQQSQYYYQQFELSTAL